MRSIPIDRLLRRIQMLHLAALLVQILLLIASGVLAWKLALQIEERYLFDHPLLWGILGGALSLIFLGRALALFLTQTEPKIASQLDRKYALKERLTTYVELRETGHPFFEALSHEAESKIVEVSPFATLRAGDFLPGLAIVTFLLASLLLLPYLPVPAEITTRRHQQDQIRQEAKELQETIRRLQDHKPENRDLRKLLAEFQKAAEDLQRPSTNKLEALRKLNLLQERLKTADSELAQSDRRALKQSLQEAGKEGTKPGAPDKATGLELEQLAKELEQALGSEELPGGKEIKSAISSSHLSRQQIDKMKKALEKYKAQSAESEKTMVQLQQAIEGAQKGMRSGSQKAITDSTLSERDLEKGKSGVEDGPGTTNLDVGPQRFDTQKKGTGEYAEDRTKAEYEKLYKGQRIEAESESLFLNSKFNDSEESRYTRIRTFGLESEAEVEDHSRAPAAQDPNESEIRKERIPASYQKLVKKYFESIHD